jgi:SCP-2 sterol transfer family
MNETPQDMAAEIEASLNTIPFDNPDSGARLAAGGLTGTCQFTITGLGTWLITFKEGMHTVVRCEGACEPPPDVTITCSPETYLHVMNREDEMNAETALHQGLIDIDGDWGLAGAIVGESF